MVSIGIFLSLPHWPYIIITAIINHITMQLIQIWIFFTVTVGIGLSFYLYSMVITNYVTIKNV